MKKEEITIKNTKAEILDALNEALEREKNLAQMKYEPEKEEMKQKVEKAIEASKENVEQKIFSNELNSKFKDLELAIEEEVKASSTAYHLMSAPTSITIPERTAVNLTPILSRMIPAKMRKNTKTFRNVSEPCMVPKAVESQPLVSCIKSLIGDRMSMKM